MQSRTQMELCRSKYCRFIMDITHVHSKRLFIPTVTQITVTTKNPSRRRTRFNQWYKHNETWISSNLIAITAAISTIAQKQLAIILVSTLLTVVITFIFIFTKVVARKTLNDRLNCVLQMRSQSVPPSTTRSISADEDSSCERLEWNTFTSGGNPNSVSIRKQ